jgi:hypothetical protein
MIFIIKSWDEKFMMFDEIKTLEVKKTHDVAKLSKRKKSQPTTIEKQVKF